MTVASRESQAQQGSYVGTWGSPDWVDNSVQVGESQVCFWASYFAHLSILSCGSSIDDVTTHGLDRWTFVDGSTAWAISSTGHAILDLNELVDLVFKVDYLFEYASNA